MRQPVRELLSQMKTRLSAVHAALDEALAESSANADRGGPVSRGTVDAATLAMRRLELASLERHARELRTLQAAELQSADAWVRRIPLSPTAEMEEQARARLASHRAAAEQIGLELAELEAAIVDWQGRTGDERS